MSKDAILSTPHIPILFGPTPLHYLTNTLKISANNFNFEKISHANLFMKRDDLTPGLGNKTRKLEYILHDVIQSGADSVITAGGVQSNHCRQTAQFAAENNIESHLMFGTSTGERTGIGVGNPIVDTLFGAEIHTCKKPDRSSAMLELAEKLKSKGKNPYIIPVGGSNHLGVIAYANAFIEFMEQCRQQDLVIDKIVFATSSGGTQAGLLLGAKILNYQGEIIGISIDQVPDSEEPSEDLKYRKFMTRITNDAIKHLELAIDPVLEEDFVLNYNYLQDGYGVVGDYDVLGVKTLANHGILSGPVYSGRAFGALIDMFVTERISTNENVLFWHTGGAGEIDVYKDDLGISN